MKDTIRLILFLKCNFKCRYCCNEKSQFNVLFEEKYFSEIDFNEYENICITGGEPFFDKDALYQAMDMLPKDKPVYLYTNGILITDEDIERLKEYNVKGINVGLHGVNQIKFVNPNIDDAFSVRYRMWNKYENEVIQKHPDRLNEHNTKFWVMDECYMPNEDWIVLKDYE